jgi:flagellar biosynthesis chaperone FliJ
MAAAECVTYRTRVETAQDCVSRHEFDSGLVRGRHSLAGNGLVSAGHLQNVETHMLWRRQQLIRSHEQLREESAFMDKALQNLVQIRLECKKLEVIRQKRHRAWVVKEFKLAQKELDDTASRQSHRGLGG